MSTLLAISQKKDPKTKAREHKSTIEQVQTLHHLCPGGCLCYPIGSGISNATTVWIYSGNHRWPVWWQTVVLCVSGIQTHTESYRHDKMPHTAQTASNSSRAQCWGTIPSQTIINSIFFSKNVRILLFSIKKKDRPTPFPFPFVKRISIFSRRLLEQCQTFACKQVLC